MKSSHSTYASAGIGGAAAVVISWIVEKVSGAPVPDEVAIAIATLISAGAGFFLHTSGDEAK